MPFCDCSHRENGRRNEVFAKNMPANFADVTGADDLFHLQYFQKYGVQAADFTSLPECVVCFDLHIVFEYDDLFRYGVVLRHSNKVFDKGYGAFGDKTIERLLL